MSSMNYTVDGITDEVRRILSRLEKQESELDAAKYSLLDLQLPFNNQFRPQEDLCSFDELAERVKDHPRGWLVLCLAAENKQLEQLKAENRTLTDTLDKHQSALDLIMKKYRLQVSQIMQTKRLENMLVSNSPHTGSMHSSQSHSEVTSDTSKELQPKVKSDEEESVISELSELLLTAHVSTLASMTREVCDQGDAYTTQLEAELRRLRSENAGLREMLMISSAFSDDPGDPSEDLPSTSTRDVCTLQPDSSMMPPNQNSCNASCEQGHSQLSSFLGTMDDFASQENVREPSDDVRLIGEEGGDIPPSATDSEPLN